MERVGVRFPQLMPILLRRFLHYAVYLLAAVAIVLALSALGMRLWVMPDIDRYRTEIEARASAALGAPVHIDRLSADWRQFNPRFTLHGVSLGAPAAEASAPDLSLPRLEATLSWWSVLALEPRFAHLDFHRPVLNASRDGNGVIRVAGVVVNGPGAASPLPDWLLRQPQITVTGGRLVWRDDVIAAPPLRLDAVDLRLTNFFGRHRFGLEASPPADSIARLVVRGDLRGKTVRAPADWSGRLYLQAQRASADALLRWAPWARQQFRQGVGDVRAWLDFRGGAINGVVGDVRLTDVAVRLDPNLPDMKFLHLAGRLDWRHSAEREHLRVERLNFVSENGQTTAPGLLDIEWRANAGGGFDFARVGIERLQLEALTALTHAVPLPGSVQAWLTERNPHGYVERIEIAWQGREHYRVQARFRDAGLNPGAGQPGFSGLDGAIEADENGGRLDLRSTKLSFALDTVFRQPLDLDELDARLVWQKTERGGYRVTIEQARLANADLAGEAGGSIETVPGQAAIADLTAQLQRGRGDAVWKYLPRQINDATYAWLKDSLRGGISPNTRLVLRGPLDAFPFADGGGEFLVATRMQGAVLDYARDWPALHDIEGWLVFRGRGMTVTLNRARILDIPLGAVKASIPDLHAGQTMLDIEGEASAPAGAWLDLIRKSPLLEHTHRFTESMQAAGETHLALRLNLPLHRLEASRVKGQLKLTNASLSLGQGLPAFSEVNGRLGFTEQRIEGRDIGVHLFGQPASLDLVSAKGGQVRANLQGRVAAAALAEWLPPALAGQLGGSTNYRAQLNLRRQQASYSVESDLVGLDIRLPEPFAKPAAQARKLSLKIGPRALPQATAGQLALRLKIADSLGIAMLKGENQEARVAVLLGPGEPNLPAQPGVRVHGNLASFDLAAWQPLLARAGTGDAPASLQDINLNIGELLVWQRRFTNTQVHLSPAPRGWRLQLSGPQLVGEVVLDEAGGTPGKRFVGRFRRLELPTPLPAPGKVDAESLPELPRSIELSAQSFIYQDRDLGHLNARLDVQGSGLRINEFSLAVPEANIEGSGWLSLAPRRASELSFKLNARDTGRLLKRLNYPEGLRGGETLATGDIDWMGRIEDFELARLNGRLKMQLRSGRFTKLEPGVGRLLGVVSLQSLPRRVALDFRDVFSEGFAFDSIDGDIHIERGALYLPALQIEGPAARVRMNGKIDTVGETQNLRLLIQPRLEESAALAGAIVGGPVVGLGALVASKVLREPLGKVASFEYLVTGSWGEPNVAKLGRAQASVESVP